MGEALRNLLGGGRGNRRRHIFSKRTAPHLAPFADCAQILQEGAGGMLAFVQSRVTIC